MDDEAVVDYGNEIVINGPFYINMNLTLKDCDKIYFGPDAEVIIEPNCQLKLSRKTYLQAGCNQMWKGIKIEGNLREDDGLVLTTNNANNPLIKDAVSGINATKDSRIKITDGDFENNHVHISMSNYAFGLAHVIRDASFTSNSTTMLSPFANTQTASAFRLNDIPSTADNNGNALIVDNNIEHADVGIDAVNTGLVVSGNDLAQHTIQSVGTGIRSVDAQGSHKITDYEIIDCDNGIDIYQTNGNKTEIYSNSITTNSLSVNSSGIGINVSDVGTINLTIGDIFWGNEIFSNSVKGILTSGFSGGKIQHNIIHLPSSYAGNELIFGIRSENLPDASVINSNVIDVPGASSVIPNTRALSFSNVLNYEIKCNTMEYSEFGLQFIYSCTSDKLKIEWNNFNVLDQGLVLGENNIIEPTYTNDIGNPSTSSFNHFSGLSNQYDLYTINTSEAIDYYKASTETYPSTSGASGGTAIGFGNSIGVDNDICGEMLQVSENDNDLYLAIINNSLDIPAEASDLFYFNLKTSLFEKLKYDEELRSERSEYEEFYDTVKEQNIGLFSLVLEYINRSNDTVIAESEKKVWIDLAISINSTVDPDFDFEANKQIINDIYLSTICKHNFDFDNTQWDLIESISYLCPYIYGDAVFMARNMFRLKDNTVNFDDRYHCAEEPPRVAFETPLSEFHLYPNPTTNAITVSFENLDDKQHYHISVSDVIGKVLWMNAINASKGKIILNCSKFADGIYFISINEMETPVWRTKFIKLK